jgi:hypothetical protein
VPVQRRHSSTGNRCHRALGRPCGRAHRSTAARFRRGVRTTGRIRDRQADHGARRTEALETRGIAFHWPDAILAHVSGLAEIDIVDENRVTERPEGTGLSEHEALRPRRRARRARRVARLQPRRPPARRQRVRGPHRGPRHANGRVVARLETGDSSRSVAFSPDGELLAIGHCGGTARLISTQTRKPWDARSTARRHA